MHYEFSEVHKLIDKLRFLSKQLKRASIGHIFHHSEIAERGRLNVEKNTIEKTDSDIKCPSQDDIMTTEQEISIRRQGT
jgi:hypothetical protein